MKKRALISVSDKTGIVEFSRELAKLGYEIVSTGGTAKVLTEAGIDVIGIQEITGYPECLDGRVKTLHPRIHGGLLAIRDNEEHMKTLDELEINTIDIVVVNLYPFRKTISKLGVELEEAIENIDIGGPSMIRAGAKNNKFVTVLVDPADYNKVLSEIKENGDTLTQTRFELAAKVFSHTASYDALIANYLSGKAKLPKFPETITMTFEKVQDLRYGENPHQEAAFYKEMLPVIGSITEAKQLHGKELSFNNINDANSALETLKEFSEPTAVAVKHANPCGVGIGEDIFQAYVKAHDADPMSIFGGIVALNREVDIKTANEINKIFLEIVIAPAYSEEALAVLKAKKNIRIMILPNILTINEKAIDIKKVGGGLLIQDSDIKDYDDRDLRYVTDRKPTEKEMKDLLFAWKVVKHVKSNGIVIGKDGRTTGIGPGQTNRIWSTNMAIERSGENIKNGVLASDAFFPFGDVVEAAAAAGISAIIQPGGSVRDQESIDFCNKYNIAMVFTSVRHFKH